MKNNLKTRKIFLISNGETISEVGAHPSGRAGSPLSELGQEQMQAVAEKLYDEELDKIFVSPRVCSYEGGVIVAGDDRTRLVVTDELEELTPEELAKNPVPERVVRFYRMILSQTNGNVAIVVHNRFIRSLICFLESRDPEKIEELEVAPGSVHTVVVPGRIGALVTAAGKTKTFIPLLPVAGTTLIGHVLDTLTKAGVSDVMIVTGYLSDELENAIQGPGVAFVHNPDYEESDTFYSAQLGMKQIDPEMWDGIVFLPVDHPAFTLFTLQQLMREMGFAMSSSVIAPREDAAEENNAALSSEELQDDRDELTVQNALAETVGAYAGDVDEQRFDADFPGGNHAAQAMDRAWQNFDRASQSFGGAAQTMDRVAQSFGGAAQVDGRDISSARSAEAGRIEGLIPCYKGKAGYPLLLAPSLLLPIMDYDGQGGMSGVLKELQAAGRVRKVELPDPAICLTCGTAGQYEKLKDYLFSLRTPGLAYCREILAWRNLSQKRLRHMEAVAFYAREMAEEFNSRGRDTYSLLLDENLTTAGGMVHDLGKGYPHHAAAGAATLRSLGLTRVAEIVENHQNLAERYFAGTSPVLIVYLADKMFSGTENVGIEERFARKAKRRQGDTEALEKLEQNKQQALRAQAVYENSILGWPVG